MKRLALALLALALPLVAWTGPQVRPQVKVIGLAAETPILELDGMSYWVAGQETDSQNLTQLGSAGAGDAQFGSTSGADSNDPTDLPWTSADGDYARLPGTSGNYLSHPDNAAVSVTGDITIQVECALDDWTAGSTQGLVSKYVTGNTSWYFYVDNSVTPGRVSLRVFPSANTFNSTVANSFTDGNKGYIRVTLDVDNGGSDSDCTFYTSSDGESWSQLGSVVNSGSTESISDTASAVEIGSISSGTNLRATGDFYSAYIWNSDIGDTATSSAATPVMHWEAGSMTQSGGADEESGSSWTINRSASGLKSTLVTRPVIVGNSAASTGLKVTNHADLRVGASEDFTLWFYGRIHDTPATNSRYIQHRSAEGIYLYQSGTNIQAFYDYGATTESLNQAGPALATVELLAMGRRGSEGFVYSTTNGETTFTASTDSLDGTNGDFYLLTTAFSASVDAEFFGGGQLVSQALSADQLATLKTELDTLLQGRTGE